MGKAKPETTIIKDALRRFHHLPTMTIAKHIIATHRDMFNGDLELVRQKLRYYTGAHGQRDRDALTDKSMIRPGFDWCAALPKTWRSVRTDYNLDPGVWLLLADLHLPFHEPKPIEAAIQYGQAQGCTGVLFNGDLFDCASVSFWPQAHRDMNREIEAGIDFLDWINSEMPDAKKVYKPGNHEYRLPRAFMAKLPELAETPYAAFESVLGLEQRGIDFLDYYQIVRAGELPIIHGHEVPMINSSVNPARGLYMRAKSYALCSHCHTTSEHSAKNINGTLLTTWSTGCLCDLSPDYNPFGNDWCWGFAVINVEKSGHFEVENRRILPNGRVV